LPEQLRQHVGEGRRLVRPKRVGQAGAEGIARRALSNVVEVRCGLRVVAATLCVTVQHAAYLLHPIHS
jgi:hypothetical protein